MVGAHLRQRADSVGCVWLQFKEELMIAMGLNTEEEGSPMAFFRRGYKVRQCACRSVHRKFLGCRQDC